jgi:hypothetical protein
MTTSPLRLVAKDGKLYSEDERGPVEVLRIEMFDGGGPSTPLIPSVIGGRVVFRRQIPQMKESDAKLELVEETVLTHFGRVDSIDSSVRLNLLRGYEYYVILANDEIWRIS